MVYIIPCVIPKLFPYGEFLPCMKLTREARGNDPKEKRGLDNVSGEKDCASQHQPCQIGESYYQGKISLTTGQP